MRPFSKPPSLWMNRSLGSTAAPRWRGEPPGPTWDFHERRVVVVAHEQACVGGAAGRRRIGHLAELAEGDERSITARLHPARHLALDRRAGLDHLRRRQAEAGGDIPLPADGGHGESATEQETVARSARILQQISGRGSIEHRERQPPAAIRHVDQQLAGPAVPRDQQGVVATEGNQPVFVPGRERQVDDAGVPAIRGIRAIANATFNDLEGAELAEGSTLCVARAPHNLPLRRFHRATPCVRL